MITPEIDNHSRAAERACIGAALFYRGCFEAMGLDAADFVPSLHRAAWDAMAALRARDLDLDPISVADEMNRRGDGQALPFLTSCLSEAPTEGTIQHYAAIVSRDAARRRLTLWASRLAARAAEEDADVVALTGDARLELERVASGEIGGPVRLGEKIAAVLETVEAKRSKPWEHSIPTGIGEFDRLVGGLRPGRLIVVAARPGIGKTSLVRSICLHAAIKRQIPCLLFSLEMTFQELAEQFIAAHSKVPAERLDRGDVSQDEYGRIFKGGREISEAPLYIDDRMLSAAQISAAARAWRQRQTSTQVFVAVDYLGLIRSAERAETRALEVGKMALAMKTLAKDLACPVVLVSQLNREVTKRGDDAEPLLSDLRDSGEVEQHAHMVVFPHRKAPLFGSGPASLIVAKNRGGKTGAVECRWLADWMIFAGAAPEPGERQEAWNER